ncbi:MAG: RNA polymerase sigma-70 factor [Desulfitobacteriaceae bacterium]|nr:RNA polymerase sigma-70 factor [Desulfitobacteriaceae bacterium]
MKTNSIIDFKEKEYLKQLSQNSEYAYRAIFLKYYSKIKFFISHLVKSEVIAEDITQDIFLKIWMMREEISVVESLNSYLFQMARNAVYTYMQKQVNQTSFDLLENTYKNCFSVDEDYEFRELEQMIFQSIKEMPSQRAKVFSLSRIEGMKNAEIAIKLKLSKKTVENHLSLALKELKKKILTLLTILLLLAVC